MMNATKTKKSDIQCPHEGNEDTYIIPSYRYSFWGWTLLLLGISAQPTEVCLQCYQCKLKTKTISDPVELKKYVGK